MKVLIADDEAIVLEGLKYIIDWEDLGFSICSQAQNGKEALEKVLNLQPDLVLLDIRMPKLTGTEIIQIAREKGFKGHFIILSGYSDFSYAQTAIKYGVDFYLTKPIDEDELENAVVTVKKQIEDERKSAQTLNQYRENARDTIIRNLLTGDFRDISSLNLSDLHLSTDIYQVIIYERFTKDPFQVTWDFAELLRVSNQDHNSFDHISIDHREVILLKGSFALERFNRLLTHYRINPQKGSPLDSLFLTYGRQVYRPEEIFHSYLGKIFTKKVGESFNSYLDRVRIEQSKILLEDKTLKVYEIAERIGYKNVDYFHKKFKKYVGESPAEYRKQKL